MPEHLIFGAEPVKHRLDTRSKIGLLLPPSVAIHVIGDVAAVGPISRAVDQRQRISEIALLCDDERCLQVRPLEASAVIVAARSSTATTPLAVSG
jgi:hypothetical protein